MNIKNMLPSLKSVLTVLGIVVGAVVAGGVLYASYVYNGLFATVVYAVLFVGCFAVIPTIIGVAGSGVPGNKALGKAHIVLGAFAFGHHYLVQRDDKWDWCPGTKDRVYIDGEWRYIEGGKGNLSVLGWRPFGILREKSDRAMRDVRVDNIETISTDGGTASGASTTSVTRGGFNEADKPALGDDEWLVDLKRLYSGGVRQIGDIDLIETAEEIIERGQVSEDGFTDNPQLTFVVSLILGIAVGYGVLFV